ncbi:gfo/Idh/MocA family oxidoreductase [Hydrogenovibrio sp. SC-1]|uniref:Gfo/Idh/MocA family protein n=1 Tax=Hydrogenovibrio sp. SC-1 TaxID=2065820 RepID=UPI000C7DF055|nr:Gfo/Idh/MocA family oxidoreductase [Hydrogenovibrio sp. SC-1]PLA75531.1 gfo/Idh/MocA family oxidoreductase [Hydrogenovibrio sp. SC-1]
MLRVGIAGYGKLGKVREIHVNNVDFAEVVAIYDIDPPELQGGVVVCNSYDELLDQKLDAVFICAYNDVLSDFTVKALGRGVHVFCEKPPARSTAELLAVIEAESASGLILKYGFNHRYHYSVMEAKKLIDSGDMGRLLWLRGVYGKAGSIDYHQNWRNFRNLSGGGILIDQGIHMLDLMMYFSGGTFEKINSFVTTAFWDVEAEDNAFAIMQNKDRVTAMLHSSATQWKHKFLLEMCFEEGYINLDGILSGTRSYAPETLVVGRREFEDVTHAMGKPKETTTWFEYDRSWEYEVQEFLNAIQGRGEIENGTSSDAFNALKLVEDIYECSGFYNDK